jgi:hypothetical protein
VAQVGNNPTCSFCHNNLWPRCMPAALLPMLHLPLSAAGCLQNYGGDAQAGSCVACPTGSQQDMLLASVTNGAVNPVLCCETVAAAQIFSKTSFFAAVQLLRTLHTAAARSSGCFRAAGRAPQSQGRRLLPG